MNLIELIRKSINNICAKYIDGKISEEDEILPIFYVAGSQTLPAPLTPEEEADVIAKLDTDEKIHTFAVRTVVRHRSSIFAGNGTFRQVAKRP